MRASEPEHTGRVENAGVEIAYEVHGTGDTTIMLLPAWAISHSRLWKGQVASLARQFRVVLYDPRGNGASDRPTDPAAYEPLTQVGDAVAVLDAVGAERAVLAGNSLGSVIGYLLAATQPARAQGFVAIGTTLNLDGRADDPLYAAIGRFEERLDTTEGWAKYNRHYWEQDFAGFVEFFVGLAMNDPHSTKQFEDGMSWGLETTPEVLAATISARAGVPPDQQAAKLRSLAPAIDCPVLVVHGENDAIAPLSRGRDLADLLDAPLEVVEAGGHCPQARYPARLNRLIRDFAARATEPDTEVAAGASGPAGNGSRSSNPRVLYLSSPIGLGHARRDLAIAGELRNLAPDVEITWLAQDPVTRYLDMHGEHVHPGSRYLASESAHLQDESDEHDLHIFEAFRRMDEILVSNFGVFCDVLDDEHFDLVVGDESWEVDHFLHEHPSLKRARFAWLTDFVGFVPMPSGGEREAVVAADYNAQMLGHVERRPDVRDTAIFVGDADDVVDIPFGPGLPAIRDWVTEHYEFSGYVTGFDPAALADREALRVELGYAPDEVVCIVAVGGSGVGLPMLRRVVDAHPIAAEVIPNLRTVVVTGPRIDPDALPSVAGVDVRAFVPDLHRHLAACDVAVVQGGLTTTMELTATRRPFVYLPLGNHFEQQVHVRHRLERHGAGVALDYASATAEELARAITDARRLPVDYRPVPGDGAHRAAMLLTDLL